MYYRNHSNIKTFIKKFVTLPGRTEEIRLQINDVHIYQGPNI